MTCSAGPSLRIGAAHPARPSAGVGGMKTHALTLKEVGCVRRALAPLGATYPGERALARLLRLPIVVLQALREARPTPREALQVVPDAQVGALDERGRA